MINKKDQKNLLSIVNHIEEVLKIDEKELLVCYGFTKEQIIENNVIALKLKIEALR